MATTTVSSIAGKMNLITADAIASYMKNAVTPGAVMTRSVANAKTVYFPSVGSTARLAKASAHTEGATITGYQVPISAVEASLAEYPLVAPVSKLSVKGGDGVLDSVGQILGAQIANTVDYNVCALISGGVTTAVTSVDGFALADLFAGVGVIKGLGFGSSRMVAILHPQSYWGPYGLSTGLTGSTNPQANPVSDAMYTAGWVNNIGGVDIYVSDQIVTYSTGTYAHNIVCAEECIGLALADPIVEFEVAFTPLTNTYDFSAASYHKAVVVHADAGYQVSARLS